MKQDEAFNETGRVDLHALFTHALLYRPPATVVPTPAVTVQHQPTDVKAVVRHEVAKSRTAQNNDEWKPSHRGKRARRW